jgi:hypothetical protein
MDLFQMRLPKAGVLSRQRTKLGLLPDLLAAVAMAG